jgi:hypothetical protein
MYQRKVERLSLPFSFLLLIGLGVFFRGLVPSAGIGLIAGLLVFRVRVKGLLSFAKSRSRSAVAKSYYIRLAIIGSVLTVSFMKSPVINPFIVASSLFFYQIITIIAHFFPDKNNENKS